MVIVVLRNDYASLKKENDNLRRKIKELEKENDILKKQHNKEQNSITSERKNIDSEITIIKDKNIDIINSSEELSKEEINKLKKK